MSLYDQNILLLLLQIIWSERLSTISPVLVRLPVLEKTIPGVSQQLKSIIFYTKEEITNVLKLAPGLFLVFKG